MRRWRTEALRAPAAVGRALGGLGRVFSDDIIYGRNWMHHPFVIDYIHRSERWRALELGLMLADLPNLGDYPKQLVDGQKYIPACAELRAGLLLRRLGFAVRRDPANAQRTKGLADQGPDWLALRGSRVFGVEVKCPRESDMTIGRTRFATQVCFAMMDVLQSGQQYNVRFDPAAVVNATNGQWASSAQAEELTLGALAAAESTGSVVCELGSVERAPSGYSGMIGPVPTAEDYEIARLGGVVEHAAEQLRALGEPGIVVLDSSRDPGLMRRCCGVAGFMGEQWAADLACVILVASTFPGFALTLIPGPRYKDLAATPLPGLRGCAKGHWHVDTFGTPANGCDLDDDFENYPAFCDGYRHKRTPE